jgi:hypothetical protein
MFLTQNGPRGTLDVRSWGANEGGMMKTAAELSGKIDEFLSLSTQLELTRLEELTLMSLDADEWEAWRNRTVPPGTHATSLLVRRLDYALALLRRMRNATSSGPSWADPRESRL